MRPRLAQVVAGQIRSMVIDMHMNAGEKLPTESELSIRYSVSRPTIREAMKILQAENIIEIRHGLGSYVAMNTGISSDPLGLSFTDQRTLLPDLMEIRLLMEPGIAELSARRRSQADVDKMEAAISGMLEAQAQGRDYHSFDYQFHIAMAESTGNTVLQRIFPVIFEAIERGYMRTAHIHTSFPQAVEYHRSILAAIADQNAAEAARLTALHIGHTMSEINNLD